MKKILLLIAFFTALGYTTASAQVVTGVYRGKMQVDSPRYDINFELTLKERNGKLMGYCYRLFVVGDTLYYNLVRVSARIVKDMLVVEDDKSVSNNFAETRRGMKTVFFFKLTDIADTAQVLPGEWSLNQWRGYAPLTGKVEVQRERNYLATQMYQRLAEKNLDKEMLFDVPQPLLAAGKKQEPLQANNNPITTATSTDAVGKAQQQPPTSNQQTAPAGQQPNTVAPATTHQPVAAHTKPTPVETQPATGKQPTPSQPLPTTQPIISKEQPSLVIAAPVSTRDSLKSGLPINRISTAPASSNSVITKRISEIQQTLTVYEDTITLSLYDNGEIDGDTVSVYLNNEILVSKVALSATAYKIQIPVKQAEILQLTLFAENLGRIPPNTGLLVVYSGEQRYQVFFTSTFEKSAVILLRRNDAP